MIELLECSLEVIDVTEVDLGKAISRQDAGPAQPHR
jgi:hypothetical protein